MSPRLRRASTRCAGAASARRSRSSLKGKWPRSCVNPTVLEKGELKRWQPYSMERGPRELKETRHESRRGDRGDHEARRRRDSLTAYPVNHLIEYAAAADIRPIIVRQERIGLHMADAISRMTPGRKIGAFCMQHGPGTENAYGGIAQAFANRSRSWSIPGGYPRRLAHVGANYNATRADARHHQIGRAGASRRPKCRT